MKYILWIAGLLLVHHLQAQKETLKTTNSFVITGAVKAPATIASTDLSKWTTHDIGDIVITNHVGEKKSEATGMKGVLIKDVLQSAEIDAPNPKALSEYYFVCKATDGYIIVYSWNELFNTATGDTAYIVTEKNGKSGADIDGGILMISAADFKTGRRQLKALATIDVRRAN